MISSLCRIGIADKVLALVVWKETVIDDQKRINTPSDYYRTQTVTIDARTGNHVIWPTPFT